MPEYQFTGKVTLTGVYFFITADTLDEAMRMARRGDYDQSESDTSEWDGHEIDPYSGTEVI